MVPNFVSAPELFGSQEIWSLHENVQGHNVQLWVGKFKFCCMLKIIQKRLFQFYPKTILPKNCLFTQKLLNRLGQAHGVYVRKI